METGYGINPLLVAFLLSLVAGLGTGLGGLIVVVRRPTPRSYGFLMGLTAGVMITLAFLELVNEAWQMEGYLTATAGFAAGALFMFLIDVTIPHVRFGETEIPHQEPVHHRRHRLRRASQSISFNPTMLKSGLLIAIGITIHNIPEGIAVGAGFMHQPTFGLFIALAILLHNIPEGIATALPLCCGGAERWLAFRAALLSGLTEPLGALLAAVFLTSFDQFIGAALAFAGGVMVFITLDELIPAAREQGHHHLTALGIITGAISVFLLSGTFGV